MLRFFTGVVQLPNEFSAGRRAGHITTNDPFNLIFALCENFYDDAD
jgi:hypothetical protein